MTPFTFVKQMAGGMEYQIGWRRNMQSGQVGQGLRGSKDRIGMGGDACGFRQQVVMHVQHRAAPDVGHRRQFMHPLPVIALVVGVLFLRVPAGQQECGLGLVKLRARHKNVDVAEQPTGGRR